MSAGVLNSESQEKSSRSGILGKPFLSSSGQAHKSSQAWVVCIWRPGTGPRGGAFFYSSMGLFFHFILILFLCLAKHSSIPAAETTLKHPDPMVSYGKGQEMGIKMNRSTLHLSTCTNGPHIISHLMLMMAPHCPESELGT